MGVWIGLVVGGFCLNLAHEDVARVDELVLVEDVVLDRCAIEPEAAVYRFNE